MSEPAGPQGVVRATVRRRLAAIEQATGTIRTAYGDDPDEGILGMLERGPDIRLGDALRVPDYDADRVFALWEIVWMLDAAAEVLRNDLRNAEHSLDTDLDVVLDTEGGPVV